MKSEWEEVRGIYRDRAKGEDMEKRERYSRGPQLRSVLPNWSRFLESVDIWLVRLSWTGL